MDGAQARYPYSPPWVRSKPRGVGRRGGRGEAFGVTRGGAAPSADLGGSSKYSNENFED
jgi:hypothetical protein